jgi:transcription-repair coupling factor (superfamily II helicase)
MSVAESQTCSGGTLLELAAHLESLPGFASVVAALQAGGGGTLEGAWGSSCALAAAALLNRAPGPLVVVCPHPLDIDPFCDDLALFSSVSADQFPAWETLRGELRLDDEILGDRTRLLKRLLSDERRPRVIVTSIQGLLQPVPPRDVLVSSTRRLRVGDEIDIAGLLAELVQQGFQGTSAVQLPGEFSQRGGILDIFAPDWEQPVRIELFGEQIDSIRQFEVATQRSLAPLDAIDWTALRPSEDDRGHLADYLPPAAWFLLAEPQELQTEGQRFLDRFDHPETLHKVSDVLQAAYGFPSVTAERIAAGTFQTAFRLPVESVERFSGDVNKVRKELDAAACDHDVYIVCETAAEAHRLGEVFAESAVALAGKLQFPLGRLASGFRLVSRGATLIGSQELFHKHDVQRRSRRRPGRVIDSFLELREGDLVVHVAHGIARYRGLKLMEKNGQVEEHLELEFHDRVKVYVPASKIQLVQKYVGGSKARPSLSRIGGKTWTNTKQQAQAAVFDLASDLLELQAIRASQPGIRFPADSEWQREFEAAFPYIETPDQTSAMEAIRGDMQSTGPMDRLICGDVGFGKTELAMRAAFKAVDSGYQAAILVPTTVLAEQHFRSFSERMAEFPFTIARLSRFCSPKEQRQILEGLQSGSIDVVIGTHRLAQPDVHFHNLGLVIIDEEQRFGVDVKERLKKLRQIVDVLTLTATPIPRTLHMSLVGLRDISNLETPPADRQAVETRVTRFDPELVRHAVLREINRQGQVFFVHNRIEDIELIAGVLRQIVPEASLAIAHGQMPEGQLEQVMLQFVRHEFDLLLSTTIIESGLDIPAANTIFIHEADRYGLADLHQLRGRVGRYKHRAYCYLLVDPRKSLTPNAVRRLRAIEEFSQLGAGFAIAMRDLEIRGAGNILGTEQSGHINAVGYELYCELLDNAVRTLKSLPVHKTPEVHIDLPGEAFLPRSYVPDMRLKIDLYRRLARATTADELNDFRTELVDRFGPCPDPAQRLLRIVRLRVLAQSWGVEGIRLEDQYAVLAYRSRPLIEKLAKNRGRLRIVDGRSAYLPLAAGAADADGILAQVEALLQA